MSVLTLNHCDKSLTAFVKGSPEMIHSLSVKETIPQNFDDVLENYTKEGLRVLAMGYKPIHEFDAEWVEACKREHVERDLVFIGFLIMENKVKPETNPSLSKLREAEIGAIMATGDNGLTGVAVGRNWGIISENKTWFLAERVKDDRGRYDIKWIKIDKTSALDISKTNEEIRETSSKLPYLISVLDKRTKSIRRLTINSAMSKKEIG